MVGRQQRRLSGRGGRCAAPSRALLAAASAHRAARCRSPEQAARIARSGPGRRAAARRHVCRRPAGLGRRRPRRDLAHRRRRPALAIANLRSRLPAVGGRVRRRPARLGGGRLDQAVQPRLAWRLAGNARRRRALAGRSQSAAAGDAGDQVFRSRSMAGRSPARRPCFRSASSRPRMADKAGARWPAPKANEKPGGRRPRPARVGWPAILPIR